MCIIVIVLQNTALFLFNVYYQCWLADGDLVHVLLERKLSLKKKHNEQNHKIIFECTSSIYFIVHCASIKKRVAIFSFEAIDALNRHRSATVENIQNQIEQKLLILQFQICDTLNSNNASK